MVTIVWRKLARKQLYQAYQYIKKDSEQAALQVRTSITDTIESLIGNPEKFPLDKYRKNNHGTYRAFEINSYRVAYQVTDTEIRILRIRHTKREPLSY
jgi:plasmid stabilization system protein ParE